MSSWRFDLSLSCGAARIHRVPSLKDLLATVGQPNYQADPILGAQSYTPDQLPGGTTDAPTPPASDAAPNGALFQQLLSKYLKSAPGHVDPLQQSADATAQVVNPGAQGLASILSVNKQTGDRAGQQYITAQKGDSRYHIYYTPDGKRQVLKVG